MNNLDAVQKIIEAFDREIVVPIVGIYTIPGTSPGEPDPFSLPFSPSRAAIAFNHVAATLASEIISWTEAIRRDDASFCEFLGTALGRAAKQHLKSVGDLPKEKFYRQVLEQYFAKFLQLRPKDQPAHTLASAIISALDRMIANLKKLDDLPIPVPGTADPADGLTASTEGSLVETAEDLIRGLRGPALAERVRNIDLTKKW